MTPVKTTTRRGVRATRRTAKKVTVDDVLEIIQEIAQENKEIHAANKELQATNREIQAAQKKNEQTIDRVSSNIDRLSSSMKEIHAAQKKNEQTIDRLGSNIDRLSSSMEEIHAAQKKNDQTIDRLSSSMKEIHAAQKKNEQTIDRLSSSMEEIHAAQKKNDQTIDRLSSSMKEIHAANKELQRVVGDLGNKFGDEAEHTLVPGLLEKFKPLGFNFGVLNPNRKVKDDEHDIYAEVDAFLENGTQTMAVEVKARLKRSDVDTHITRMEKLRRYADLHGDRRDLFGAMAATVVSDSERDYALEKGFYVIEPSGEDVNITKPDVLWQP